MKETKALRNNVSSKLPLEFVSAVISSPSHLISFALLSFHYLVVQLIRSSWTTGRPRNSQQKFHYASNVLSVQNKYSVFPKDLNMPGEPKALFGSSHTSDPSHYLQLHLKKNTCLTRTLFIAAVRKWIQVEMSVSALGNSFAGATRLILLAPFH